jgi:predicted RNase H-like HicB family nuclease
MDADMKMPPVYLAAIEPEDEGGYSVSFPDLEGCFSQGETFDAAARFAAEAMAQWLEVRGNYPAAGDPAKLAKAIIKAGAIPAAIEAPPLKVKVVPVTISLSEIALRRIDAAATLQGVTRSAFISSATLAAAGVPAHAIRKGRRKAKPHAA